MIQRSSAIEEKMRSFTDAGMYERDQYIDFEPEGHVYTYKGEAQLLPVSSLIAYFFEPFNAEAAAQRQWERYRIPVEESLTKWKRIGCMASEADGALFPRGVFRHRLYLPFPRERGADQY